MSTNPNPTGETKRIDASEATATGPGGTPIDDFSAFSIEISDEYTRERTVDNNTIDFDALLEPSGEFSVFPTSAAAAGMWSTILARPIGGVNFGFPENDARGSFAAIGVRYDDVSQDDLGPDGYEISGSWAGAYVTSV